MKRLLFNFILLLFFFVFFSSCSPRIVGIWNVESFETVSQGQEMISAKNIGTITFLKNGTGVKDFSFNILGIKDENKSSFNWNVKDNMLTISGWGSGFMKTWIIIEDYRKHQKLQSTDGADQVQIINLRK